MQKFMALVVTTALLQPALTLAAAAPAKDYPSKFIRIVVPYGAGAGPDVVGRIIAEKLGPALGTNIVFENRGGGGGMLGTEIVAKSAPDGYTLLLQVAAYATYPFFFKNVPYDSAKDLIPVTLAAKNVGYVLVVNPALPARSVKELVALAKANPSRLNYGTAGVGSVMQMAAELFAYMADLKLTPVHYTGVPAALSDVISGQIEMGFPAAPSALPFTQAGRLRVLAITSDKRWHKMADTPTLAEAGVKGYKYPRLVRFLVSRRHAGRIREPHPERNREGGERPGRAPETRRAGARRRRLEPAGTGEDDRRGIRAQQKADRGDADRAAIAGAQLLAARAFRMNSRVACAQRSASLAAA